MHLLRISGLRLGYGHQPDVVSDASLEVRSGQTVAILGASGGGKTTLVKAVAGLLPPRAGVLEVVQARWPQRPPAGSVGYVPQRLGLVRHASLLDNVLLGGLHETSRTQSLLRRPPPALVARAQRALEELGLGGKEETPIHLLSGGQQRRAAVARALVQRPRLLLADEFLGELDPATMETVVGAVKTLQQETSMGVVIIEHHLDQAQRLADRVFQLQAGVLRQVEGSV